MTKIYMTDSLGRWIPSFLRNQHIDFHHGHTNYHSHQQWNCVPLVLYSYNHGLSFVLLNLAIVTALRLNLKLVLIWASLMDKGVEHVLSVSQSFEFPILKILLLLKSLSCF